MHVQGMHKMSMVYTLAGLLSKIDVTRNIFEKDIQRHSKENIHLKSCCNEKMFLCTIDWF